MRRRSLDSVPYEIRVRVIPRAKRDEVAGERDGRLLIRTTAPPVDDKANRAVCRIVAAHVGVASRAVEVVTGHHTRDKTIRISGGDLDRRS